MSAQTGDIGGKRLQILQGLVPRDKAVAILLNPETPFSASALQELRIAAQAGPTEQRLTPTPATTGSRRHS